jgi:hypothetical protein
LPIAQDQPFAESLSFDTAYRYSDYNTGQQTNTYKFGLEWAPWRTSACAAATSAQSVRPTSSSCSRPRASTCSTHRATRAARRRATQTASDAECIATGVPANLVGAASLDSPAGQ